MSGGTESEEGNSATLSGPRSTRGVRFLVVRVGVIGRLVLLSTTVWGVLRASRLRSHRGDWYEGFGSS